MGKLDNRVAIITGASAGIGKQVAIRFAEEGANVAICARHMEKLAITKAECEARGAKVVAMICDVRKLEDMQAFVAETVRVLGGIDILYNNAMSFSGDPKPLVEHSDEELEEFYVSGLLSTFRMMKLCFPYLRDSGHGKVICIGSGAGVAGESGMGAYGCIKEGIRSLSRTAAREWGQYNINVNTINPGAVTEAIWDAMADWPEEERDPMKMGFNPTCIGRLGDPYEDIAPVAVFLASEDSRHITGQTIMAEGGVTMTA